MDLTQRIIRRIRRRRSVSFCFIFISCHCLFRPLSAEKADCKTSIEATGLQRQSSERKEGRRSRPRQSLKEAQAAFTAYVKRHLATTGLFQFPHIERDDKIRKIVQRFLDEPRFGEGLEESFLVAWLTAVMEQKFASLRFKSSRSKYSYRVYGISFQILVEFYRNSKNLTGKYYPVVTPYGRNLIELLINDKIAEGEKVEWPADLPRDLLTENTKRMQALAIEQKEKWSRAKSPSDQNTQDAEVVKKTVTPESLKEGIVKRPKETIDLILIHEIYKQPDSFDLLLKLAALNPASVSAFLDSEGVKEFYLGNGRKKEFIDIYKKCLQLEPDLIEFIEDDELRSEILGSP